MSRPRQTDEVIDLINQLKRQEETIKELSEILDIPFRTMQTIMQYRTKPSANQLAVIQNYLSNG